MKGQTSKHQIQNTEIKMPKNQNAEIQNTEKSIHPSDPIIKTPKIKRRNAKKSKRQNL